MRRSTPTFVPVDTLANIQYPTITKTTAFKCDTKASRAQPHCKLACARLASSPQRSVSKTKLKPPPIPIPETVEISADEQAEIEALLPQTPKKPPKLLSALEEKQIKEEPIPGIIQQLLSKYQNVFEDHTIPYLTKTT